MVGWLRSSSPNLIDSSSSSFPLIPISMDQEIYPCRGGRKRIPFPLASQAPVASKDKLPVKRKDRIGRASQRQPVSSDALAPVASKDGLPVVPPMNLAGATGIGLGHRRSHPPQASLIATPLN
jgi:hypothetical protein